LPCKGGDSIYTIINKYEIINYIDSPYEYKYFDYNDSLIFEYNYDSKIIKGSPIIYYYTEYYNDMFYLKVEVANPDIDKKYYINEVELLPDSNNILTYGFADCFLSNKITILIFFYENKQMKPKKWIKLIDLNEEKYFDRKCLEREGFNFSF